MGPTLALRVHPFATVFVDGQKEGVTPLKLKLSPGRHILKFVHLDRTRECEVDVKAGGEDVLSLKMREE